MSSLNNRIYMPKDHMEALYTGKNPLVRIPHMARLNALKREVEKIHPKGLRILDAGCGEGHLLELLMRSFPENQYYGIDATEVALVSARKRCPDAHFHLGDLKKISAPDQFFDIILCSEVLEHIPYWKDVLREFTRVLKSHGHLIITFPNEILWTIGRFFLGKRPIKVPDHVNSFYPNVLKKAIPLPVLYETAFPFKFFPISLWGLIHFKIK